MARDTDFKGGWGRCPQRRVKGWVLAILAMLAPKSGLRVAPGCSGPRVPRTLTLCPPDLAGQAGFQRC